MARRGASSDARAPGRGRQRALGFAALVLAVVAAHGCVSRGIAERMADAGADAAMPPRIEVAYVRDLVAAAPPARGAAPAPTAAVRTAPRAAPRAAREAALFAEPAASAASAPAADDAASASDPAAPVAVANAVPAAADDAAATAAAGAAVAASSASSAAVAPPTAASGVPFDWPSSTRLRYSLTGNYRGEIHGSAQVEWVRRGDRYQAHVDVTVGLPFAPLLVRRTSSQGRLGADGLQPERYDEDSKRAFRERRHATVRFEPDAVILANGERRERPPGVQDSASQFIQLTWLFTTDPRRLAPGTVIELPLALPRKVDRWVYEVAAAETLATPFGPLDTFHLRPRRTPTQGVELTAEMWLAPTLRHMPVRIRIRQDDDTFIDLLIDRPPQIE